MYTPYSKKERSQLLVLATPQYGDGVVEDVITHMYNTPLLSENYLMDDFLYGRVTTKQMIDSFYAVRNEQNNGGPKRIFHLALIADEHYKSNEILWDAATFLLVFFMSQGHQALIAHHYYDDFKQHWHIAVNPDSLWGENRLIDDPTTYQKVIDYLNIHSCTKWTWCYSNMECEALRHSIYYDEQ